MIANLYNFRDRNLLFLIISSSIRKNRFFNFSYYEEEHFWFLMFLIANIFLIRFEIFDLKP